MTKFEESRSELGFFWSETKPANKWPGRVFMETFPSARLHCMNDRPGDGAPPLGTQKIFHGVTEDNEYITMLEASARLAGSSYGLQSATEKIAITANYMLVGSQHFDASASVRRLRFSSSVVEHVLRLFADPDYKDIRHRKSGGTEYEIPILRKQVASYVDVKRKLRFRAFRPRVPTTTIEPMSSISIDFFNPVTPKEAAHFLHEFRSLLTLICGQLIDLWDVQLIHKRGEGLTSSALYFADWVQRPKNSNNFPFVPLLDIGADRELFRRIIAGWLAELPYRRIARGAFNSIQQDEGVLSLSHLRELVTIVEMLTGNDGAAPLPKGTSRALRCALKAALKIFAAKQSDSANWVDTITKRIDNINYHDAKRKIKAFLSQLPTGFVSVPETFHDDVIDLRNVLVHDMTQLNKTHYSRLAFFVAKLKAAYAVNDAIALGARAEEIRTGSSFLVRAEHMPPGMCGYDIEDDPEVALSEDGRSLGN